MNIYHKKIIHSISLLSIIILVIAAFITDFKKDFYLNFLYIKFSDENVLSNIEKSQGYALQIIDNKIITLNNTPEKREIKFAETLIEKPNGFYFNKGYGFYKKGDSIYCMPILSLIIEKLKIKRQTLSYLPYLLIIFVLFFLSKFIENSIIDKEIFWLIIIEQIVNYSLIFRNFGFNALFDNCYTSFLFYFYLCFLLLQFFAIKYENLYNVYFIIIWLGEIIVIPYIVYRILNKELTFKFDFIQIVLILLITIRHSYKNYFSLRGFRGRGRSPY